jgi:VWFA-related protein
MRHSSRLAIGLLLVAGFTIHAQQFPSQVSLKVVAVNSSGNSVPDLTAADFKVFDNGAPQQIVAFRLNQNNAPRPLVILFDLLNSGFSSRGAILDAMKKSLPHLPSAGLYLYLLTEDGGLYPVHALPGTDVAKEGANAADSDWMEHIGPLLDAALRKTNQLRPEDVRASSSIALPSRFKITCNALDDMRAHMASLPGPKELLWVTYGFPSSIRLAGDGWWDGRPLLRQLGTRFVRSDITIYTVDPSIQIERGVLNRDALDVLTAATGGHTFETSDMNRAVSQAEADARINYSIEYQPPAKNWDGKYHKLRVTIARKGIHLQTEQGYYAVQGS